MGDGRFWDIQNIKARLTDGSALLGPSAGLVQRHFVEARLESLYTRNRGLEEQVKQALIQGIPGLSPKGDRWLDAYKKITRSMQAAELTINFNADRWFATENNYETYAQAYEKSGFEKDAKGYSTGTALFKGDKMNPALLRASQDDKITFPAPKPGRQPSPQRGLMPGRQSQARVETQMRFDAAGARGKTVAELAGDSSLTARSQNAHFNPKTKQVFAGLNYGRRLNGSCVDYGYSYFVLHDKLKVNAIYFGGDTFYHKDATQQAAYGTLGSLVAWADANLMADIVRSCYNGTRLDNTKDPKLLVEGHLFQELRLRGNIKTIYLAAKARSVVHHNAEIFSAKHNAQLVIMG